MKIISDKNKLTKIIQNETNLGFVPTMGAIHKGHISLIKRCIAECKKTVVSIYINKPQFNKKSDFKNSLTISLLYSFWCKINISLNPFLKLGFMVKAIFNS